MAEEEKKAPTSLKRGMPAEQNNGLFGAEDRIMALGVDGRFTAVVVFDVADIIHSEADGTRRPLVEFVHIEPIWDEADRESADDIRDTARAIRAGETQLAFPDPEAPAEPSAASPAVEGGDMTRPEPQWEDPTEGDQD
jgi:hypothetical protein